MAKLIVAAALLVSATTTVLAQAQPYRGANPPGGYDTYGEPYSGSAASRQQSHGW